MIPGLKPVSSWYERTSILLTLTLNVHWCICRLFKWGAATLLELSSEFNISDPLIPNWQSIVQRLTPGPVDANGSYMVNSNTPFNVAHRHFSHLFHIYPLHLVTMGSNPHDDAVRTQMATAAPTFVFPLPFCPCFLIVRVQARSFAPKIVAK